MLLWQVSRLLQERLAIYSCWQHGHMYYLPVYALVWECYQWSSGDLNALFLWSGLVPLRASWTHVMCSSSSSSLSRPRLLYYRSHYEASAIGSHHNQESDPFSSLIFNFKLPMTGSTLLCPSESVTCISTSWVVWFVLVLLSFDWVVRGRCDGEDWIYWGLHQWQPSRHSLSLRDEPESLHKPTHWTWRGQRSQSISQWLPCPFQGFEYPWQG